MGIYRGDRAITAMRRLKHAKVADNKVPEVWYSEDGYVGIVRGSPRNCKRPKCDTKMQEADKKSTITPGQAGHRAMPMKYSQK